MTEVSCVNLNGRVAVMEDGQVLAVTNFIDAHGEECEVDEAIICVAGPDKDGMWVTFDFSVMEKVAMQ